MSRPGPGAVIGSILVGSDGSQTARVAVAHATELARALGARLLIVSAYAAVGESPRGHAAQWAASRVQWTGNPREDMLAVLESAQGDAREAGVEHVETFARVGDAADAILDVAEEQRCDLIVVGHKGMTGATRFLLGSVPNKVSHHAPCSVMIVRTG